MGDLRRLRAACRCHVLYDGVHTREQDEIKTATSNGLIKCSCGVDYIQVRTGPLDLGTELCAEYGAGDALEWWPSVAEELPDDILGAMVISWVVLDGDWAGATCSVNLRGRGGELHVSFATVLAESEPSQVGRILADHWREVVEELATTPVSP